MTQLAHLTGRGNDRGKVKFLLARVGNWRDFETMTGFPPPIEAFEGMLRGNDSVKIPPIKTPESHRPSQHRACQWACR